MYRLITARTSEINKNVELKFSNRTADEPIITPYGESHGYEKYERMKLCLVPLSSTFEANAYGVNLVGSYKATLTKEQSKNFNQHTHIWIEEEPEDLEEPEYIVKNVPTTLNYGLLVIAKKVGESNVQEC